MTDEDTEKSRFPITETAFSLPADLKGTVMNCE